VSARRDPPRAAPIPRIALTPVEAAASYGFSLDSFERYVEPHLKLLRLGSMVRVPVSELARFADEFAEMTLP
jgi:hypothetical protein